MAKDIAVKQVGLLKTEGVCQCGWLRKTGTQQTRTAADVKTHVRRHAKSTGHTVMVQTTTGTLYSLKEISDEHNRE